MRDEPTIDFRRSCMRRSPLPFFGFLSALFAFFLFSGTLNAQQVRDLPLGGSPAPVQNAVPQAQVRTVQNSDRPAAVQLRLPHPIPPPSQDDPSSVPSVQKTVPAPASSVPAAAKPDPPAGSTVRVSMSSQPLLDQFRRVIPYAGQQGGGAIYLPSGYAAKQNEFRGVFISTIQNLDFPRTANAEAFRTQFRSMAAKISAAGFNTIIFQVRPSCDAFYPSILNPWSRWLSGKDGAALEAGFDPLAFMIAESRLRGLKFYAWMNPFRVGTAANGAVSAFLSSLNPSSFARRNPNFILQTKKDTYTLLFLDPGRPEVLRHVVDSVRELAGRYRPDGILFDDYFYPYQSIGTQDAALYKRYAAKGQTLDDWRRGNINLLVKCTSDAVHAVNKQYGSSIQFGISPFGIWANRSKTMPDGSMTKGMESYTTTFADSRKWVKSGWVDFVIPQVFWGFAHQKAPYAAIVNWWANTVHGTKVKLYIGMGVYNVGVSADMPTNSELTNQLLYHMLRTEISGSALFPYRSCFAPENAVMTMAVRRVVYSFWKGTLPPPEK